MKSILGHGTAVPTTNPDAYRVMVVDDSAVIRGLLTRALESDPDIKVVTSVGDGQAAVRSMERQPVDVVVLDVEMPVMDGLTAIPKLLAVAPHAKIIMASTLTLRNADISLKAMQAGAADYIPKPTAARQISGGDDFRRELLSKVRALGAAARRAAPAGQRRPFIAAARPAAPEPRAARPEMPAAAAAGAGLRLRPMPAGDYRPDVIAIGSSTGGPQALFEVLNHLKNPNAPPILITQHMPATFTTILAEHITRQCGIPTTEAKAGETVHPGHAYVAPGDFHMLVSGRSGAATLSLTKDPPENFCRPAVDPMMRSIVKTFGRKVLAIILTGMGQDGLKGCREVAAAGGAVVGQDEQTSVVWGMPGAVAQAGLCSAVLPLKEIGPFIRKTALRSTA